MVKDTTSDRQPKHYEAGICVTEWEGPPWRLAEPRSISSQAITDPEGDIFLEISIGDEDVHLRPATALVFAAQLLDQATRRLGKRRNLATELAEELAAAEAFPHCDKVEREGEQFIECTCGFSESIGARRKGRAQLGNRIERDHYRMHHKEWAERRRRQESG